MPFGKLLPREGNFFELFKQHGGFSQAERQADRITAEVNRLLHKTFITPIDREQIHGLINSMDDICACSAKKKTCAS